MTRPSSIRVKSLSDRLGRALVAMALVSAASDVVRGADVPGSTTPRDGIELSRDVLLQRFDANRDGRLDLNERTALRNAFGSIDVPMLPSIPYDYTTIRVPNYIARSTLDELDNTPDQNPLTDHGATLGRVLFYERQLSKNNTTTCGSCHPQKSGLSDLRRFSIGFEGKETGRNAMGLVNLRYLNVKFREPGFFWDERASTLEAQSLLPIQDHIEMGMTLPELKAKLQRLPYYPPLFEAAFGTPQVTSDRIARALAQFMRSMVSFNAKFDQAAEQAFEVGKSENFDLFTAEENLGKRLFLDGPDGIPEFACAMCHVPPTFNMPGASNNGLELNYADQGLGALGRPSNDPLTPSNDGKFKASSLRNVAITAPYMHDGRFETLEEVVEHYSEGVQAHENLGLAFEEVPARGSTSGYRFTAEEKAALVAFMKTLTDETFISDPRFSDPFVRLEN